MKTSIVKILQNSWPYGLILGIISIVLSLLLYIFNVNLFSITFSILSFIIFVLVIPITMGILGGNNLRLKYTEDRQISYLDAALTCLIIFLTGFILSNLYSYVFNNFIDPEYMKQQMAQLSKFMEGYNLPQEKIDEAIAKSEDRLKIGSQLLNSLIFSVILSAIVALFIRKKDKVDEKAI